MKSKFYGMWEMGKCMRTEEAERMPEGWTGRTGGLLEEGTFE